jgi:hypothetical protein
VDGADHSFAVLKRSGRRDTEVMEELALTTTEWCRAIAPQEPNRAAPGRG